MKKIIFSILTSFFLLTGLQGYTQMYISFTGVDGESTAKGITGAIEINSVSMGASNSAIMSGATGGASVGKATMSEMVITKQRGNSSSAFQMSVFNGRHITKGDLRFFKTGAATPYLVISLEDVIVSSWKVEADKTGALIETISLIFARLRTEDAISSPDGMVKKNTAGWDFQRNISW